MESLVIEADPGVMPYVRSEVRNGVLHLYLDGRFWRQGNINAITLNATIVMRDLDYVTLSGMSNLVVEDLFTPERFRFNGRGVSSLAINLNTNQLEMELSGVSTIEINANVSGYSRLNSSGVSTITGSLITEQAIFDYNGTGAVTLTGSATNANINAFGASNLHLVNFPIRTAIVNTSGASNITINATESLIINASGVSTVRYTGTTNVQKSNSGMSTVSRL